MDYDMTSIMNFILNNPSNLQKEYFFNNKENLLNINYCNHGIYWTNKTRDECLNKRLKYHKGYRCEPYKEIEKTDYDFYHKNKKTDIFFQFKKFIKDIPLHITHFQVRKNFILLDNKECVYTKHSGIETYNLIKHNQHTLCNLPISQIICFDITRLGEDYIISTGLTDGHVNLYKVTKQEFDKIKNLKMSKIPVFDNYLTKIVSNGTDLETMACYIKFLPDNKLLTTHNDGYVRIFDLNSHLDKVIEYKQDCPVNFCSFNANHTLLACIGDSKDITLFDTRTRQIVNKFQAHYDYGTVIRFKQGSDNIFASGNQDYTAKIWDYRNLKESCISLYGLFESIGDLQFYEDKLIFCENLDYVHVYDMNNQTTQCITYVGSLAGICIRDNSELIVGIESSEPGIGGIMIYDLIKSNLYN